MKIISYLFIGLLLVNLLYQFTSSLNTSRKIGVADRRAYENFKSTTNKSIPISSDGKVIVKTRNANEFLFLNNGSASLVTTTLGLIIFVLVTLLLFSSDSIRFKIYQSHSMPYLVGLLICSALFSWYFTASFVSNSNNGLVNFKYRFDYGSGLWLLYLSLISWQVLRKFKEKHDELNLQVELHKLSHQ